MSIQVAVIPQLFKLLEMSLSITKLSFTPWYPNSSGHIPFQKVKFPAPSTPPAGCRFHPRCDYAIANCSREIPPLVAVAKEHWVACPVSAMSLTEIFRNYDHKQVNKRLLKFVESLGAEVLECWKKEVHPLDITPVLQYSEINWN